MADYPILLLERGGLYGSGTSDGLWAVHLTEAASYRDIYYGLNANPMPMLLRSGSCGYGPSGGGLLTFLINNVASDTGKDHGLRWFVVVI